MSGADAFPYPPDSPEEITGVQKAFKKFASDLRTAKGKVSSDGGVIGHPGGWTGSGSQACAAEISGNSHLIGLAETAMGKVDTALGPYGKAIDHCRGEIDKLRKLYDTKLAAHNQSMKDITGNDQLSPKLKQMAHYDEISSWNYVADGLYQKYQGYLKELNGSAKKVRTQLESIGSHIGKATVNPKSSDLQLRLAMTAGLPMLDKKYAEADAKRAAGLMDRAAKGDKNALKELQKYGIESANKYFATALMNDLGAKGLTEVPGYMAEHIADIIDGHSDDDYGDAVKDNRWILNFLSNSLATATNFDSDTHVSTQWLDELKKQGRSWGHELDGGNRYAGYWALGQILRAAGKNPPYSARFMSDVGNDMIDWEREAEKNSPTHELPYEFGGPYFSGGPVVGTANLPGQIPDADHPDTMGADPLIGLMHAAGTSREGAQAILTHGENLDYLLHDRRDKWADKGNTLGQAIEAATTGHDPTSLDLTARTIHILAQDTKDDTGDSQDGHLSLDDGSDALSGLRDSTGRMLSAHISDINTSLANQYGGTTGVSGDLININNKELGYVLFDTEQDKGAYDQLVKAQVGYAKTHIDAAAATGDVAELQSEAGRSGQTLGYLVEAHKQGLQANGQSVDDQNSELAGYVKDGLGLIPVKGGPLAELAADKATDWLTGRLETHHYSEALAQAGSDANSTEAMIHQMVEGSMVEHHVWSGHGEAPPSSIMDGASIVPFERMTPQQQADYTRWVTGEDVGTSHGSTSIPNVEQVATGSQYDGSRAFTDDVGVTE